MSIFHAKLLRPLSQASSLYKGRFYVTSSSSFSSSPQRWSRLRILFCGSDEFSNYSLLALHQLQAQKPETIASIDVVCRPDKHVGRERKQIKQVPIKPLALSLNLNLHQIDTFTQWTPPTTFDLVIAVSFGLLVPPRILNATQYGGLNIHPSLLPDLRGPAPIAHTILQGRAHTGVTLQRLHPRKFDHGVIVAQTPRPGFPVSETCTPQELIAELGPKGAEMLREAIVKGLFIDPESNSGRLPGAPPEEEEGGPAHLVHAPKLTTEDARVDWATWTAEKVLRYSRVFDLWDVTTYQSCTGKKEAKRVKFRGPWKRLDARQIVAGDLAYARPGRPFAFRFLGEKTWHFAIETVDEEIITPESASIEAKDVGTGLRVFVPALQQAQQASRI